MVPPPAYLWCVLTLRWGDPAQHKLPQQQQRGARHKKFLHRNGQVSEGRLSFTFHVHGPRDNKGLDIRIDCVDKQRQIWDFCCCCCCFCADFSLFGFGCASSPIKRGVRLLCGQRKCGPLRSLAVLQALPWFFCCFWDYSADLVLTQGRVPLPARVLGSFWTAVGWKGAKFQRRSRSGQSNCESS